MYDYNRNSRLEEGVCTVLYHATSQEAARQIMVDGYFKCGQTGMAGGAIYFGVSAAAVMYKNKFTRQGVSPSKIAILTCEVQLGRVKVIAPFAHDYTFDELLREGFDSVEIVGKDVHAVFKSDQIKIIDARNLRNAPRTVHTPQLWRAESLSDMDDLLGFDYSDGLSSCDDSLDFSW
eukprot:GEMP01085234.1.p1 GENE.GEMP01085234.1~~GEMP01085234.1.p1  ORF type:complete len:192 (+),score=39.89 GEMP01085234.1:47-577(+)